MEFKEMLNTYMIRLNCSAKMLADASSLSPTVLSRYRSGERVPSPESPQFQKLCNGIALLAEKDCISGITLENTRASFLEILTGRKMNPRVFGDNLGALISVLGINKAELSRFLNYDPSYLSRICSGQRTPANLDTFILDVTRYIVRRCNRPDQKAAACSLLGCTAEKIAQDYDYQTLLLSWLGTRNILPENADVISDFLQMANDFCMDSIVLPESLTDCPSAVPEENIYYGKEEMLQGELFFFQKVLEKGSAGPVFLCSDIPNEEANKYGDYYKRWLYSILAILDRGMDIRIIHDFNMPFPKTGYRLAKWLPIYMTGHAYSYYMKDNASPIYGNLTYVSDHVIMAGDCIRGQECRGKFWLSSRDSEIRYYREKSAALLEHALPLVEVFRQDQEAQFKEFLVTDSRTPGNRHFIYSSFPFFMIEEDFFSHLLYKAGLPEDEIRYSLEFYTFLRGMLYEIVRKNRLLAEIPLPLHKDFKSNPVHLALSALFLEKEIVLSYEDYMTCIRQLQDFQMKNPNFRYISSAACLYPNLQISIHEGKWALISKESSPVVHFVLRHTKLLDALEQTVSPEETP